MIKVQICPNCGSEDVHLIAGGITGQWMCKNCGYIGSVFEKEIIGKDMSGKKTTRRKK